MKILFADTFYLLALLNRFDQHAERATSFRNSFRGTLLTTDFVLLEVADALGGSEFRDIVREFFFGLRNSSSCEVVELTRDLFDRALNFYHRHADKDWSLTDCTSFVLMRDRGIKEALTGDKHFEQAGFIALLK